MMNSNLNNNQQTPSHQASTKTNFLMKFFFFIVILVVLGVGGFAYYQWQAFSSELDEINTLKQNVSDLQNDLQNAKLESVEFKKIFNQSVASMERTEQAEVNFAQTAYLVQMAYYYVEVMHQPAIAIKLLSFALDKLAKNPSAKAFQLKQTLTSYLSQLKAVPPVDLEKILQEMHAMNPLIDSLVLKSEKMHQEKVLLKINAANALQADTWQTHVASAFEKLSSLVVIRRHTALTPELLAPNSQAYLLQHLHLYLQQAQWAALNRENQIYQSSLQEVKTLINKYFINQTQLTTSLIQTIDQLLAVNVAPPLPDLSGLLSSLDAYQDTPVQKSPKNQEEPNQKNAIVNPSTQKESEQ